MGHHHRHSGRSVCSHCGHHSDSSSCSDSSCDISSKKSSCNYTSKGCGCGCKNCNCSPKDYSCASKSCCCCASKHHECSSKSCCGSQGHNICCSSHDSCKHHHGEHPDFAKKLLEVADCAWMEVLKEKIKEEILSCSENHLDELAKIVSQANHERWKHKMNKCRARADYEERVCGFFKHS